MYGELPSDGSLVPRSADQRHIFTVSQLNREARELLEGHFFALWVEGEISNLARPASGHWYFSLKDEQAQLRCAMFRGQNRKIGFKPDDGTHILVRGRISLYEARGDFQLIVEHMEEAGSGALQRAFEALKARLDREGLFAREHKQSLPSLPRAIGVVTSPSGAAIRDILSILKRRFPAIPVIIYPTAVQGQGAAAEITAAIELAGQRARQRQECDVLIVARGGGSLEDLWAFNEEQVARAIYACPIPVVSGVGHEIDTTIADFVADVRAPTPSGAAELASPDGNEWLQTYRHQQRRLLTLQQEHLRQRQQQLQWLTGRLRQLHPGQRLQQQAQRLDELERRLRRRVRQHLEQRQLQLKHLHTALQRHQPMATLRNLALQYRHLEQDLQQQMQRRLEHCRQQLRANSQTLDAVSPLATLGRGYAIVQTDDGHIVRHAGSVSRGQQVHARLGHGRLHCTVDATEETTD
jgi:exodeoxyribonuclease VII large subunit